MAHTDHRVSETSTSPGGLAACLSCGGIPKILHRLPHIWHQPVGSPSYEILWCDSCEFGFLNPRPDDDALDRFERDAQELSRDWPAMIPPTTPLLEKIRVHLAWRVAHGNNRQIDARRIHQVAGSSPASICIFGENLGPMLQELHDLGHRVVRVESRRTATERDEAGGSDIGFGSIEDPPAEALAEPFDVVVLSWNLQRSADPAKAIRNAMGMLKPGGLLLADVPNHGAYTARRLGPAWYFCDAGRFLSFFTSLSLLRFFESAGFSVVDLLYCNYTVQFRNPRLVIEQAIWDRLYAGANRKAVRPPRRKSQWELWRGLLGSMFRGQDEMYEVVGIVGRKGDV